MKIFDRFRKFKNKIILPTLADFEKIMYQYFYGDNSDYVDEETAIKFGAIATCITIISSDLGMLPLEIRKLKDPGNPSKGSEPAIDHPLYYAFKHKSNNLMTAYNLKERIVSDLLISGNSYCYKHINLQGQVTGLTPLYWQNIEIDIDSKNRIIYKYQESPNELNKIYSRDFIFHISLFGNGFIGKSPIEIKREQIQAGLNAEKFTKMFYKQGLNSGIAITMPGAIKDKDGLRKELKEKYSGLENTGKPLILEDGMQIQKVVMPLKDAEFIESKKFNARDIASFYRVPPVFLNDNEFSTYSNTEQMELSYTKHALLPISERIENFIDCFLLTEQNIKDGYFSQYDYNKLLKADTKTRAESNHIKRQDGIISANEWRNDEGMNPREEPEADKLLINGNMRSIDEPYLGSVNKNE